jgi:hypothetical protein
MARKSTVHVSNVCSPNYQFRYSEQSEDLRENFNFGKDARDGGEPTAQDGLSSRRKNHFFEEKTSPHHD